MHIHRKFWFHFFSRSYAPFELRNLAKMKDTTVFLVSATPLKPLNRIAWNFVVMKDIMWRYAFLQEMLIWSFWGAIYIPFFVWLPVAMLGIAIHRIQHSQAMLERGVCELAHSFFHLNIWIRFTQKCIVKSLVKIGPVVVENKILKFCKCIFAISLYPPWEKGGALHLCKLESPSPKDALCQV